MSISKILVLFFAIQLVAYTEIYGTVLPASFDLFIQNIIEIVNFSMLKPETIIQIFEPDFEMDEFIFMTRKELTLKGNQISVLSALQLYLVLIGVIFCCILVSCCYKCVKKTKVVVYCSNMYNKSKEVFVWNGFI